MQLGTNPMVPGEGLLQGHWMMVQPGIQFHWIIIITETGGLV